MSAGRPLALILCSGLLGCAHDPGGADIQARPSAPVQLLCDTGLGNCDGAADNGCETRLQVSPRHCGACGHACGEGSACLEGRCSDYVVGKAVSEGFACLWTARGALLCEGRNHLGQLGLGTRSAPCALVRVGGFGDVVEVAAGPDTACARRADGEVICWGVDLLATRDPGAPISSLSPTPVPGLVHVAGLAVAADHACAILATRQVACWGSNAFGQLGTPPSDSSRAPRLLPGVQGAKRIYVGGNKTCVDTDEELSLCFGQGALGTPRAAIRYRLRDDGRLFAWPSGAEEEGGVVATAPQRPRFIEDPNEACGESDRDGDGFVDAIDRCPDQPERFNGIDDGDGCADAGESLVAVDERHNRLLLGADVSFEPDGSRLQPAQQPVLDHLAAVLRAYPRFALVEIQAHLGPDIEPYGRRIADQRAEAVRAYLTARRVAPERLVAVGVGESHPIASNRTAQGRAANERIEIWIRTSSWTQP